MNAEKKKALQCLKTAKGQIEGIIRMIEKIEEILSVLNKLIDK